MVNCSRLAWLLYHIHCSLRSAQLQLLFFQYFAFIMDKRIDDYIQRSAAFAQPVLIYLRKTIHEACPQIEETIKWGFPHFEYKGIVCSMAAFKNHCAFGFWKARLMKDFKKMEAENLNAMGHLGKIKSMQDLPPAKVLKAWVKEAVKLNEEGVRLPDLKKKPVKAAPETPEALAKELLRHKKAAQAFEDFSPSHKKEYIEWVTEAKTEETRNKRIKKTIEWLAEGKPRNWQYMK